MNMSHKINILTLFVLVITLVNVLAQGANPLMYFTVVFGIIGYGALFTLSDRLSRK